LFTGIADSPVPYARGCSRFLLLRKIAARAIYALAHAATQAHIAPMKRAFQHILGLCLVAVISLSSIGMAIARADMALGQTIVLCIGADQIRAVIGPDGQPMLDDQGQPVSHDMPCLDCVIGAVALPDGGGAPAPQGLLSKSVDETTYQAANHAVRLQGGQGRGPPVLA